jgi:hypothetical protein
MLPPSDSTMEGLIRRSQRSLPLVTLARFHGDDNQAHLEQNRKLASSIDMATQIRHVEIRIVNCALRDSAVSDNSYAAKKS